MSICYRHQQEITLIANLGFLLSGNLGGALLLMARTLLVSRLISLQDFGIAATLMLALALVEMMSALGFQQQIIQSPRGNLSRFQSGLHGVSILRAAVTALALLAMASPLATFFGIPDVLWAFQFIAVVPLVTGAAHLDVFRLSRRMLHRPTVMLAITPPLGSLLAVWPLSHFYTDFRLMLYAICVQVVLQLVTSHAVAQRRYRLRFDMGALVESLRFGWPIMCAGALMFLVFNGERAIVGRSLGLEALAIFSIAVSFTLTPALVLLRTTMSFFLPQLSQLSGAAKNKNFAVLATATLQSHLFLGCVMVAVITMTAKPFIDVFLGDKYLAAGPLLVWLAVLQAFRVFGGGCSVIALATGRTKNEMLANIARVALLPVAWIIVARGGDILSVIWVGILGEAAGFAIMLGLALYAHKLRIGRLIPTFVTSTCVLFWILNVDGNGWGAHVGTVLLLFGVWLTMRDVHRLFRSKTAKRQRGVVPNQN